jgi:hypothetical protein
MSPPMRPTGDLDALAAALPPGSQPDSLPAGYVRCSRRPHPYETSFPLELVELEGGAGTVLSLVLKHIDRDALPARNVLAKPEKVHDARREPHVYRRLLAPHGLDRGIFRGAWIAPDGSRARLLLELVAGDVLFESGDLSTWEAAARFAAAVHATHAERPSDLAVDEPLLAAGAGSMRAWFERAERFAGDRAGGARFRRLRGALAAAQDVLDSLPRTLIHGELYPSNLLVRETGAREVVAVDWEMAALGPGLIDLAALTGGDLPDGWRAAIEAAYWDELAKRGRDDGEGREVALACCRLYLAIQWLGWAPRSWEPPVAHRQDWLAVAAELAEAL